MSDARWFEVAADVDAATRHFTQAVALFAPRGLEGDDLTPYMRRMALMHALKQLRSG